MSGSLAQGLAFYCWRIGNTPDGAETLPPTISFGPRPVSGRSFGAIELNARFFEHRLAGLGLDIASSDIAGLKQARWYASTA
jgi:hypothetical protein